MSNVREMLFALLQQDLEAFRAECDELDRQGWDGAAQTITAAFLIAVDRRFQPERDPREIVRVVADTRIEFEDGPSVDPSRAEALIKGALGEEDAVGTGIDADTAIELMLPLLYKIVADLDLSDSEVADLLTEAEGLAARQR